jgi:hypothetical protein
MAGTTFENAGVEPLQEVTLHKPEGTRRAGRPAVRQLDRIEYLKTVGARIWRQMSQDGDQWRAVMKEAKVHHGM